MGPQHRRDYTEGAAAENRGSRRDCAQTRSFAQDLSTALRQLFRFGLAYRCDLAGEPHEEVPMLDLASGGTTIEIRRADEGFSWQRLDPSYFAFRSALAESCTLGTAAAIAAADPAFHSAAALDRLFDEGLVVGLGAGRPKLR